MSTRFDLKFSQKTDTRKASLYFFLPVQLAMLSLLKEATVSPLLIAKHCTFDNLFCHYDILAKTCSRMTITFSHLNDAGSHANTT